MSNTDNAQSGIAIIGMSGRFPGANNVEDFWQNVKAAKDTITHFTEAELELEKPDLSDGTFVYAKGILDNVDQFDAQFFGYLPKEAAVMDPQHRIFLEICWEAMENAGYDTARLEGAVGVYGGCYMDTYLLHNLCSDDKFRKNLIESIQVGTLQTELGNDKDYLATRVAFKLGLTGPAMTLQTACSTSLVSIATACQALETYGCDYAMAGGVTLIFPQYKGYQYKEGGMLSPDGVCRTFDADAAGTVFSHGAAVVVLKRAEDAIRDGDTIYAIIKGYATNNDGSAKVSYTAPSVEGQADVIAMALGMAQIDAGTVGYVEAHGTATPLGDPIEIAGLSKAYRYDTDKTEYCAIGSVKAHLGHLDVASGAIGLIKTMLCVREGVIPPLAHFNSPNPNIDFSTSPFYVNTELKNWDTEDMPRRAGVSSFGVGGTNAHVVMEEYKEANDFTRPERAHELFVFSAKTENALQRQKAQLAEFLQSNQTADLSDIAYTLQNGRREFAHRDTIVAHQGDISVTIAQLNSKSEGTIADTSDPKVIFMFPGQATQYVGMAAHLYAAEPVFRDAIDHITSFAISANPNISNLLSLLISNETTNENASEILAQTEYAQPAIFAVEMAMSILFKSWGIMPKATLGHSVGEIAGACVSGLLSLKDATILATMRGKIMQEQPKGWMLAVRLNVSELEKLQPHGLSIAAINSAQITVVSGACDLITEFSEKLNSDGIQATILKTSHAFHSDMMRGASDGLFSLIDEFQFSKASIPIFSTLTGEMACDNTYSNAQYWVKQMLSPVRFSNSILAALREFPDAIFLEVGPGAVLGGLVRQCFERDLRRPVISSSGPAQVPGGGADNALSALGLLWQNGVRPNWQEHHNGKRRRIPLPTYPFERKRHWVEPTVSHSTAAAVDNPATLPLSTNQQASAVSAIVQQQMKIISSQIDLLSKQPTSKSKGAS